MEPCKKYVTCIMTFFIPFTSISRCQLNSVTYPVLFTKNNKLWNERQEYFLYIWLLQCNIISKEVENHIFRHNRIFRHTCMHKQLILTKQWNYNIFEQVLHSYLRCTDRLSDVLFLLLAVMLSELQTKKETLSHEKKYIEVCEAHHFLAARPPSYAIFYRFFHLFPPLPE